VAAERRERMRLRLFCSAMALVAEKGPAATSIDDVISRAGVSRGTFYKYFEAPEVLVRELALALANELISMADPIVQQWKDPAERVAAGIRLVSRLAVHHPVAASFLVRLGWPDARGPDILLDFVRRDLTAGIRSGRFREMPIALALNIVAGSVLGATHCMLQPRCPKDFAEQSAAAALRGLGVDARSAERLSTRPLGEMPSIEEGLLAATPEDLPAGDEPDSDSETPAAAKRRVARR
jgi:AcrR family transcriptional regulator